MVSAVTVTASRFCRTRGPPFKPVTTAHSALVCDLPPPRKESRGLVSVIVETLEREGVMASWDHEERSEYLSSPGQGPRPAQLPSGASRLPSAAR